MSFVRVTVNGIAECNCFPEDKTDNGNLPESELHGDFDFIDNGSLVELAHSDSECSSKLNG